MILGALLKNPLDRKPSGPVQKWQVYLFGVVILCSIGLYVYGKVNGGPVIPTSTVPAVVYEEVKKEEVKKDEVQADPAILEGVKKILESGALNAVASESDVIVSDPAVATSDPASDLESAPTELPASKNLAVPFTSQAPFANWDVIHEDTCEEASVLMVVKYYEGLSGVLDSSVAENAMLNMVDVENKTGYGTSLTAAELAAFSESYFKNVNAKVIEDPTIDEIKTYVSNGTPVIVPAAGRLLGNPFFSGAGPLYHYLVIRGFEGNSFITNDPGTRHGENYLYSMDVIMKAIGDWNNGAPETGAKRILILEPIK